MCVRACVSSGGHLVVVTDEDVHGGQQELEDRLLVTLLHLETQTLQEARRTLGSLTAAVLGGKGGAHTRIQVCMNTEPLGLFFQ